MKISDQDIGENVKTKLLGVITYNKVSWKVHINFVAGTISRGIGMITKVQKYIERPTLIILYYFVCISLSYLLQQWMGWYWWHKLHGTRKAAE